MRSALIARNSLWIALDVVSALIGGAVISVLVARLMGPERLGHFSYVMWVAGMAGTLATSGIAVALRRYAAEAVGRSDWVTVRALVRTTFRWQAVAATVVISSGTAVVVTLVPPQHRAFTLLAVLSVFPFMLMAISAGAVEATQRYDKSVKASVMGNLTNLLGTIAAVAFGWDLVGLTAALLASRLLDCILRYRAYRECFASIPDTPSRESLDPSLRGRVVRFAGQTTVLLAINVVVWDRSEVFFLKQLGPIQEVGFYSLSFSIVRQVLTIPGILAAAAGANLLVEQGRDPARLGSVAAQVVRFLGLLSFPLALGLAAISGPLVRLLYGEAFRPAIPVLVVVAVLGLSNAFLMTAEHLLAATENQGFRWRWGAVAAALNITFDLLFIPWAGALGAAVANGLAQGVATAGLWAFVIRRLGVRPPWSRLSRMLLSAFLMALLCGVVASLLPLLPGLVIAVLLGLITYPVLLRLTRSLDMSDQPRLLSLEGYLPGWLGARYAQVVRLVAA